MIKSNVKNQMIKSNDKTKTKYKMIKLKPNDKKTKSNTK
jgi:hypothetical protein